MLVNTKKLSEYICRQLRYHQHWVRHRTRISLENTLNAFKCLTVLLLLLTTLLWQQHHFWLFQLASSVNKICCQICTLYSPIRKKRCTLFAVRTDVHTWQQIYQRIYLFVCHYIVIRR